MHYDYIEDGAFSPAVLGPFASNPLFSVVLGRAAAASFLRHDLMAHNDVASKQPSKTAITGGNGAEHSPRAFITGPDSQIAARSAPSCAKARTSCTHKGEGACVPKATNPTRMVWRTSPASDSLRIASMNGSPVPRRDTLDLKGDRSASSDGVHSRTQPGCACTRTVAFVS